MAVYKLPQILIQKGFKQLKNGAVQGPTGKFVSRKQLQNEARRGAGGRFLSKATLIEQASGSINSRINASIGAPRGGGTWAARIAQSSEILDKLDMDLTDFL